MLMKAKGLSLQQEGLGLEPRWNFCPVRGAKERIESGEVSVEFPWRSLSEQAKSLGVWGLVQRINEAPGKVLLSLLRRGQIHGVKRSLSFITPSSLFT